MTTYNEFIEGFAAAAGLSRSEADAQWAAWSRQLPDWERDEIEAGGCEAGEREGRAFAAQHS